MEKMYYCDIQIFIELGSGENRVIILPQTPQIGSRRTITNPGASNPWGSLFAASQNPYRLIVPALLGTRNYEGWVGKHLLLPGKELHHEQI